VGYAHNGTHHIFKRIEDDSVVYAVIDGYDPAHEDYFVFQIYYDGERWILSEWGMYAEGTYAGGICFLDVLIPSLIDYTFTYGVFSWTDVDGDGVPQPVEIKLETMGN
jgi:hypothetical protein